MTWQNPFLKQPAAVADPNRHNVAAHFADLAQPQWQLEQGRALADLTDLQIVEVNGPDRLTLLTTLSTQILTTIKPGQSKETLFLDPHGHIRFAAAVIDDGTRTLLIVEPGWGTALVEFINSMRFNARIQVTQRENLRVVGRIIKREDHDTHNHPQAQNEPTAQPLPGSVGTWVDPWPGIVEGGASYTPPNFNHPAHQRQRVLDIFDAETLEPTVEQWLADGGTLAGSLAWEALRIEDLRPRQTTEVDERTLPPELDWLRTAVHLNKGCYCGQETIARIVNLGKPPRRLVALQLDGSQAPTVKTGAAVYVGARQVGKITSVARHADLGIMALALVRRGLAAQLEVEVETETGRIPALQEIVVDPAGKSSASPARRPGAELPSRRLPPPTLRP